MRRFVGLAAVCLFSAGPAVASSIETVTSGVRANGSIASLTCPECPPLQVKKKVTYIVPQIANGSERVEIRELNGEMKLVRTEAWLGGSPVVFINKASGAAIAAARALADPQPTASAAMDATTADMQAAGAMATVDIDRTAKTSALGQSAATAASATDGFDPAIFELRLK